jgi:hypothetical protein
MCPGNPTWKWETVAHGVNAFLIWIPTAEDLARIDGMQMSVPKIIAHAPVTSWAHQDVSPEFVMEPVWVHVDGVPWAVGSLVGNTLDVDLCSLQSQGIVRVLVAMRDLAALEKHKDGDNHPCLEVVALLHLSGYRFRFWRGAVGYMPDPRFRPFFLEGQ